MLSREQFKTLAAGKYAELRLKNTSTIQKQELELYVEGALFGWDLGQMLAGRLSTDHGPRAVPSSLSFKPFGEVMRE